MVSVLGPQGGTYWVDLPQVCQVRHNNQSCQSVLVIIQLRVEAITKFFTVQRWLLLLEYNYDHFHWGPDLLWRVWKYRLAVAGIRLSDIVYIFFLIANA